MDIERFGFFSFEPQTAPRESARRLKKLLLEAERLVGPMQGVVLPECAITPSRFASFAKVAAQHDALLIAGVTGRPATAGGMSSNAVRIAFPKPTVTLPDQEKHHRWALDRFQIQNYGLGSRLDPDRAWWEHIPLGNRELNFVSITPRLTFTVLVCEDLARQDPVASIVRSVGPNLVIALLMDGPQLPERWPAHYATVLADDPGSSVLTLTSAGMACLCRPPKTEESRSVALWKDIRLGPIPLKLPSEADALVLCLSLHGEREYTADGRYDDAPVGYPLYAGLHAIRLV